MDKERSEIGGMASDERGGEATIEDIDAYNKLYAIAYGIKDPRYDNFEAHPAEKGEL